MRDFIKAQERLSNPLRKWVREGFKDTMVSLFLGLALLVLLTQSNGVI